MKIINILFAILLISINCIYAQKIKVITWGDQGNGMYKNPILNGDYSDPDVIRVNDDFYMVTSTFHMSPGATILHSKDLVNWTIVGHAFTDLSEFDIAYSPDKMQHYSHGIWACSIRYHDGKFWVYVFDTGFGLYMTTATNGEGPWEPATQVFAGENYSDPCPFWDDNGQMYVSGARYPPWVDDKPRMYDMFLWKLSPDGKKLQDSGTIIHRGIGSEGTKILKLNGFYYIFYCEHQDGDFKNERMQMVMRSKNLYGPYETHRMIQQRKVEERQPCQGGLVDTKDGSWWFIHQHGDANYLGRQAVLEPVTWVDGWPIVGKVMPDGVGSMIWEYKKPIQGFPITRPQSSDDFSSNTLQPQWMWNHAPRNDKWSLTERKGFLRLYASKPCFEGFWGVSNTITQRTMGEKPAEATILLGLKGMEDGQEAGLCAIGGGAWMLQVYQENGKRILRTSEGKENNEFNLIVNKKIGSKIWMKVLIDKNKYQFQYSLNGKKFENISASFTPYFTNWRAIQLGIFSYNKKANAGYIDVDWFKYEYE